MVKKSVILSCVLFLIVLSSYVYAIDVFCARPDIETALYCTNRVVDKDTICCIGAYQGINCEGYYGEILENIARCKDKVNCYVPGDQVSCQYLTRDLCNKAKGTIITDLTNCDKGCCKTTGAMTIKAACNNWDINININDCPSKKTCGNNNQIDTGEGCDNSASPKFRTDKDTCQEVNSEFTGGTLACKDNCIFNTDGCTREVTPAQCTPGNPCELDKCSGKFEKDGSGNCICKKDDPNCVETTGCIISSWNCPWTKGCTIGQPQTVTCTSNCPGTTKSATRDCPNCEPCNNPLGLFGLVTQCSSAECYLERTKTIIDSHQDCAAIGSCYDYKSKASCENMNCSNTPKGSCEWNPKDNYLYAQLGSGVCRPKDTNLEDCKKCNDDNSLINPLFNSVFDTCNSARCGLFGSKCYYDNGQCKKSVPPELSNEDIKKMTDSTEVSIKDKLGIDDGAEYGQDNVKFIVTAAPNNLEKIKVSIRCESGNCIKNVYLEKSDNQYSKIISLNYPTNCLENNNCELKTGTYIVDFGESGVTKNVITKRFKIIDKDPIKLVNNYFSTQTPEIKIRLNKKENWCKIDYTTKDNIHVDYAHAQSSFLTSMLTNGAYISSKQISTGYELKIGTYNVKIKCNFIDNSEFEKTFQITVDTINPVIDVDLSTLTSYTKSGDNFILTKADDIRLKVSSDKELSECRYDTSQKDYNQLLKIFSKDSTKEGSKYIYLSELINLKNNDNTDYYIQCKGKAQPYKLSNLKKINLKVKIECGNSIVEAREECDGSVTKSCTNFDRFAGGNLICSSCKFNTNGCTGGTTGSCGNNRVDTGETCDGTDFGPVTKCSDINNRFTSGNLACYAPGTPNECHFNTTNCLIEETPTLTINLLEPNAGYSTIVPYHVKISTDNNAECKYLYSATEINYPSYSSLSNQFTTTDNKIHSTLNDIDATINYIYINCRDLTTKTENKKRFKIGYDIAQPEITNLFTDDPQNKIIEEWPSGILQKKVFVKTNKEAICRYDKGTTIFNDMQGKFTDERIDDYKTDQYKDIRDADFKQGAIVTFNVVCKARNGLTSNAKQISINVNLLELLQITDTYPKGYIGKTEIRLKVITNKHSNCRFYNNTINYGTTTDLEIHESNLIIGLKEGQQEFDVECTKGNEKTNAKIMFIIDTSPPSTPDVEAESFCYGKNGENCKIKANWSSEDPQSGIKGYRYYVANATSNKVLFTEDTNEEESDELDYNDLDLESKFNDGDEFKFLVSAQNNAGVWSENGTATVEVDYSRIKNDKKAPTVTVEIKDGKLIITCNDNVDEECAVLKYYLSKDEKCPNEDEYDSYIDPVSVSELISYVCWIAEDSSGNINKGSKKISEITVSGKEKDTDKDGMPDDWEIKNNLDPKNPRDALDDNDKDGLTNLDEYRYGTDPNKADTDGDGFNDKEEIDAGTDPLDKNKYPIAAVETKDTDKDGMPDSWEEKYSCLNKSINDANKDSDNDGLNNIEEYRYRTNPCDPDTDKDGYTDKVEIDKGTNPLDNNSYPKSRFWLWALIIIIGLTGLGAIGYFGYNEYKKTIVAKERKVERAPVTKKTIEVRRGGELFKKKIEEKEKEREKVFEEFKPKLHEIDVFERVPKKEQEDIFKRLPGEKDIFKRLPKIEEDIFERLPGKEEKNVFERLPKPKEKRKSKKRKKEKIQTKIKKKNKKSQMTGEVIIYILAVLIFGLIVIFGYGEINKLMQKQKDIDLINFEKELKSVIEGLSASYGDVKVFDSNNPLNIPGGYSGICFIEIGKYDVNDEYVGKFSLIMNSWKDNVKANIFLVKNDMEYSFYANNITIEPRNSECFTATNGKIINMRLEGVGGSAKISKISGS